MENYSEITRHLEDILHLLTTDFQIPHEQWRLQETNTIPGPSGEEEKIWLRGSKDSGFYASVTTSFDENGDPEEKQVLIWAAGLPDTLSVTIQSAPDFFNTDIEQVTLNLTAPARQLSEILACKEEGDDGFSFFKKLTKRCFPDFSIQDESWKKVEAPSPLDDSQSTEGTMVHVMGTDDYGFRRTVESNSEEEAGNDRGRTETTIFTASGLPGETEMTMYAGSPNSKNDQQFSLHVTAAENYFAEIILLFIQGG